MTDNLNNIELLKNSQKNESILVEQNIGLVKTIAKRFLFSETEYDDLVQVGTIGLLKAIRTFDTTRGVMFSAYAVPVIAGEIKKFLRDNGSVKISRVLREQYLKLQREQEKLTKELERNPTVSELAEKNGNSRGGNSSRNGCRHKTIFFRGADRRKRNNDNSGYNKRKGRK